MDDQKENSYGPIIGLVIIILVIALGSVYFLQKREKAPVTTPVTINSTTTEPTEIVQIKTQGKTDDISSIQNDLNTTNMASIDAGIIDIGTAVNAQ